MPNESDRPFRSLGPGRFEFTDREPSLVDILRPIREELVALRARLKELEPVAARATELLARVRELETQLALLQRPS